MSLAVTRLTEERKLWRKDHPFGFYARPITLKDGTLDMMRWECGIPGRAGTAWENGLYKLSLAFPSNYPAEPPKCVFAPPLPHPNIFPSGAVCLSIISDAWKPSITIKQILVGIQDLLTNPNPKSPANGEYLNMMKRDPKMYELVVQKFAAAHAVVLFNE